MATKNKELGKFIQVQKKIYFCSIIIMLRISIRQRNLILYIFFIHFFILFVVFKTYDMIVFTHDHRSYIWFIWTDFVFFLVLTTI